MVKRKKLGMKLKIEWMHNLWENLDVSKKKEIKNADKKRKKEATF